jgi:hypothetical protein
MNKLFLVPLMFAFTYACQSQQGPTPNQAVLTWTQAVPTATSGPVTGNCVYRGTLAGTYILPALGCSSTPITTYTDSTLPAGSTAHYAVTAHFGVLEGPYSNDVAYTPPALSAPNLGTVVAEAKTPIPTNKDLEAMQAKPIDDSACMAFIKTHPHILFDCTTEGGVNTFTPESLPVIASLTVHAK